MKKHAITIDLIQDFVNNLKDLPLAIEKLEKTKPNNPLKF